MKKIYLFFLLNLITISYSTACDICGCGVGGYYLGLLPQFNRNFVGLRYRYMSFDSHLGVGTDDRFRTTETFRTAELWGRFYPHKKVQVLAFVPYSFNEQNESGTTRHLNGLGDMSVLVNYNLLNTTTDTVPRLWNHVIWLGGGVKLPTGRFAYNENDAQQVANPNFQLGTGSTDFVLNAIYTVRYKNIGINTDISAKLNTANSENYLFGHRVSGNILGFYAKSFPNYWTVMPHAGLYAEYSNKNTQHGQVIPETGGTLCAGVLGVEVQHRWLSVGANFQEPFAQNLSDGHVKAKSRFMVQCSILF
ncbi:MAG: hypothetical protein ACOVQA_01850 [Thermoflexibacteraceae bacterium]|jgi:hypothetical protein